MSQIGTFFPLLKCWQGSGNRYPSNGVIPICANGKNAIHIATQGSLFGQFPGNSVISARPEMNAGRGGQWVDSGGFAGAGNCWKNHLDGGLQLRLSGKGSVSFLFSRRLLFSDPSVLTSQRTDARNAAMKTASGPAGENWAKLATRILERTHTVVSCKDIQTHCTVAIQNFKRGRQQDTVH